MIFSRLIASAAAALLGAALFFVAARTPPAMADDATVADFYRGKTITIVVGSDAGGGYDLNARALS